MESNGWISLHRKLLDSVVFGNEKALKIWVWCLLRANHAPARVLIGRQVISIKPGQFIMGSNKESEFLKIAKTTLWRWLEFLEGEGMLELKKTTKYTIVTIPKWEEYQGERNSNGKQTLPQVGTNNKNNNENKNTSELSKLFQPSFSSDGNTEVVAKPHKVKHAPAYPILNYWNSFPNWKATGRKETPKNPSVVEILLPKTTAMEEVLFAIIQKNKKYTQEQFEHAIKAYATEIANRSKDAKGYYQHRFTLYEFLTHTNIFERYVTR